MQIQIEIPQEVMEYLNQINVKESEEQDVLIHFINDTLNLHSGNKLLNMFKKWEIERGGTL
jgi:hypothetical protein